MTMLTLLTLAFKPHRLTSGQRWHAGTQASRMSDSMPKAAQLSTFLKTTNAPSVMLRVVVPSHPLIHRLLLTHSLYTVATNRLR